MAAAQLSQDVIGSGSVTLERCEHRPAEETGGGRARHETTGPSVGLRHVSSCHITIHLLLIRLNRVF